MKSHNKSYDRFMFNQIKAIFATYFLHIVQGQASGFHILISLLNSCKDLQFLKFQVPEPIYEVLGMTDWKLHEDLYFRSFIKVRY